MNTGGKFFILVTPFSLHVFQICSSHGWSLIHKPCV